MGQILFSKFISSHFVQSHGTMDLSLKSAKLGNEKLDTASNVVCGGTIVKLDTCTVKNKKVKKAEYISSVH
jgi:hypothetical protein